MESAYGIGVQNRYALFLDEEDDAADPYALLANSADTEPKAKVNATAAGGKLGPKVAGANPLSKTNQKSATGTLTESKVNVTANQKDAGRQNRDRNNDRSRSGNQSQRPIRGDQENRTQRSPRPNAFNPRPYGESKGEDGELKEGGGRDLRDNRDGRPRNGFGGPRGGRRGGPGAGQGGARFSGKRDFNRHSGSDKTGVKATEKRDGAGAHNWGKSVDDFTAAPEDELVNGEQTTEGAPAEGAEPEAASGEEKTGTEAEEPKSDEPQLKTLDEYKREREEKRIATQFNIRKANEGEDKTKWKKTYVLKKKVIPDEEEVEYEEIEVEEDASKRRGRQVLDIEVNFRPSEEGRDFVRRGRGGPGGRGRGGPRGGPDDRPRGPRPEGAGGENAPRTPRQPREGGNAGFNREGGSGEHRGRPSRGGRGQGGRFQAAPKFDDLNDFPSL